MVFSIFFLFAENGLTYESSRIMRSNAECFSCRMKAGEKSLDLMPSLDMDRWPARFSDQTIGGIAGSSFNTTAATAEESGERLRRLNDERELFDSQYLAPSFLLLNGKPAVSNFFRKDELSKVKGLSGQVKFSDILTPTVPYSSRQNQSWSLFGSKRRGANLLDDIFRE